MDSNTKCHSHGLILFGTSLDRLSRLHVHDRQGSVQLRASTVTSKGTERLLSRHIFTKLRQSDWVAKIVAHAWGLLINAILQNWQTCVNSTRVYTPSRVRGDATRLKILKRISIGRVWMCPFFGGDHWSCCGCGCWLGVTDQKLVTFSCLYQW